MSKIILEKLEEYKNLKELDFNLNFKINKKVKEGLDEVAKKNKVSTSRLLRLLIEDFLDQIKKGEKIWKI